MGLRCKRVQVKLLLKHHEPAAVEQEQGILGAANVKTCASPQGSIPKELRQHSGAESGSHPPWMLPFWSLMSDTYCVALLWGESPGLSSPGAHALYNLSLDCEWGQ